MPILSDLSVSREDCRKRLEKFESIPINNLHQSLWARIVKAYSSVVTSDKAELVDGQAIKITTGKKKNLTITLADIPKAIAVVPYYRELLKYEVFLKEFQEESQIQRTLGKQNIFKLLPGKGWELAAEKTEAAALRNFINGITDKTDQNLFEEFLSSDVKYSGVAKKTDRGKNYIHAAVVKAGNWLANSNERRGDLVEAISENELLYRDLEDFYTNSSPPALPVYGGMNKLFYGAPGTGKSYLVEQKAKALVGDNIVKTIFYPDMQNSDFIGSLKPAKIPGGGITYSFSPGPFAKAVAMAAAKPGENVVLVVEELNRAPAAAVFGELFLLLDRDENGQSEYSLDFPSEEFALWFSEKTSGQTLPFENKLYLPANLSIFATMNSADQGVYPLDTAFRRRWHSEYVRMDYASAAPGNVKVVGADAVSFDLPWGGFVKALNEFLTDHHEIEEDRLVGPWFLNKRDLTEKTIPGKLLIYLWDDLLRHDDRKKVFFKDVKNYGQLNSRSESGQQIFSDALVSNFQAAAALPLTQPDKGP
tara:strand:+ start:1584 stop:3185 length:1602 start_codon:yes stop_codon:yes gene_type:complete